MALGIDTLEEFKKHRNEIEESLETIIVGRDKELDEVCKALEVSDYLIMVGPSGVGKSRLAVAGIEKYHQSHTNYKLICTKFFCDYIKALDDILEENQKYILFIDDASSYSKLKELLEYIKYRNCGNIKTVLTVRDYLKECFYDINNNDLTFFEVKSLDNNQIKEAITENTIIKNDKWLDQIVKIANGNIRVAFIAANEALKEGSDFKTLFNQKDLLSKFYRQEISKIDESNSLIITAGIIAFFRKVYLEQLFYILPILQTVGLSKQSFVNNVNILISKEIIDDYKNVVMISDQCFADYLLNYVIVEKEYLRIKDLILVGFKYYSNDVLKSLGTILNVYYNDDFVLHLKESLIEVCNILETDIELKRRIEVAFSRIIPEYVLKDLKKEIDEYNDKRDIKWLLSVLNNLAFSQYSEIVLAGIFKLLRRTKTKTDEVLKMLSMTFAFDFESTVNEFKYLCRFIDCLIEYKLYNEQMYSLVSSYLKFNSSYSKWNGKKEYVHYNFSINDNMNNIIGFRNKCWDYLFNYNNEKTIDVIIDFAKYHLIDDCFEIIKNDLKSICLYLENVGDKEIIQGILYAEFFDDLKNENFELFFDKESKYLEIFNILLDRKVKVESRNEYNDRYKNEVSNYYLNNKSTLYETLIAVTPLLKKYYKTEINKFIDSLIDCLDYYNTDIVKFFILNADYSYHLVENVVNFCNLEELFNLINDIEDLSLKDEYLFSFYKYISINGINKAFDFSNWLKQKYDADMKTSRVRHASDLKNIAALVGISYDNLIKYFFNKQKYNPFVADIYLSYLLYENKYFKELLDLNQKLAIEVYEFLIERKEHDTGLECLSDILNVKKNYCKIIARKYIDGKIEIDENEELFFKEEYCELFFTECINACIEQNKYYPPMGLSDLVSSNINNPSLIQFLEKYIDANYKNDLAMMILFDILSQVQSDYKDKFLLQYYKKGNNSEILRCAILHKTHIYGDARSYFNSEIKQLELLKKEFLKWDNIDLVSFIDTMIDDYKNNITYSEISRLIDYDNRDIIEELKKLDYKTEISAYDAFNLYVKDEEFRKVVESGYVTYNGGSFVNNKSEPLKFVDYLDNKKVLQVKVQTDESFEKYYSEMKGIVERFEEKDNATLDEILVSYFIKKNWNTKEFFDNTWLERDTFSKIKNNQRNKMTKKTLVQILIGLKLPKNRRDYIFLMNGTPLSTFNEEDVLYSYILASQMDISTADELLRKLNKTGF